MDDEFKNKISKITKGKFWCWNPNTLQETTIYFGNEIPNGYIRGRKPVSIETRNILSLKTKKYFEEKGYK